MDTYDFSGDIFKWNISTLLNYIKNNYIQFILLICVFIIIYVVDYISNINAMIFTFPSIISTVSTKVSKNINSKREKKPKIKN